MKINGFLVVRLPHLNYIVPGRDLVPCLGDICYAGVDRQKWLDVFDQDFFEGNAPEDVMVLGHAIKAGTHDFTGIDVCRDWSKATRLLQYSNRNSPSNELIAIRSPALNPFKDTMEIDLPIEWLGHDFVRLGEWSLIAGGLFMDSQFYHMWLSRINGFGLFSDASLLSDYALTYEAASAQGCSEPLGPATSSLGTVAIEVGRIQRNC